MIISSNSPLTLSRLYSYSPVFLISEQTTQYPLEGLLEHFQTPRSRETVITQVPLVSDRNHAPLISNESSRPNRQDLFGAPHPIIVTSAKFFNTMLHLWQYLPLTTDCLINRINSQELNQWHFVYVAPLNIASNILSVSLLPIVSMVNVLASAFFLARFVKNYETQDINCVKFFIKGFQITTVLGFINFSKALFPGLPIANILQDYRAYVGFQAIARNL
jgi:hypothetical protein